jgi:16S rRNA (uracil1498-N3)-methyltransferase
LAPAFLSEVELYYSNQPAVGNLISIEGEECHHISNVMRHNIDDILYVTDGKGTIHKSTISKIERKKVAATIAESTKYDNKFSNIWFCVPRLKSADRFEFALEKSVELGITNFIIFDSQRAVAKGEKIERWKKILLAAMKQSLRAWLPKIQYVKSINEIVKLDGKKILFDQKAKQTFQSFLPTLNSQLSIINCFFIFGPEGGFTNEECGVLNEELTVRLTGNRLRSETAIVTAASVLASDILQ